MEVAAQPRIVVGSTRLRIQPRAGFGVVVLGRADEQEPAAYLDEVFADPVSREAFFALVDAEGLVVARNLRIDPAPYRPVGGRRGHGRLSQGEFFHHDGCSTPIKPRVVETRCPPQRCVRTMGTSVAPFPEVVHTMLRVLSPALRRVGRLEDVHHTLRAEGGHGLDWVHIQGLINRVVRQLETESARAYFQDVDSEAGSFCEPWTLGESRFIANTNAVHTAQHRRACRVPWEPGTPNGHLIKRWPAEELAGASPPDPCLPCAAA